MVATATGEMNKISEEGTIELANSNLPPIKDVSFTPFFKRTLLSAGQANKQWKSTIIMDYDSVRVFKGKIPDRQIQNKKMGDGIMIGNMYYFPMKIQNTNFAINQRSKMNQVDGNQPIARTDQHPLETIIEAKDPTLPPKPILMQRKIGPKQKQYKKERRDMMRRERHSLPYWHARLGHLSGLHRTISLGAVYGDDHWKWHVSGGPVLGANETREFIIRSLGATRKGGGRNGNDTRVASTARCNRGELS